MAILNIWRAVLLFNFAVALRKEGADGNGWNAGEPRWTTSSPSARRARIEIRCLHKENARHYVALRKEGADGNAKPSERLRFAERVALRKEGADGNYFDLTCTEYRDYVALRKEGADGNPDKELYSEGKRQVALRKEGADGNSTSPRYGRRVIWSPSARRARIEIILTERVSYPRPVALRKEGADGNRNS